MIKIEKTEVYGWEAAIRGMRNPMNSWDKSDSFWEYTTEVEQERDVDGEHIYKSFFKDRYFIGDNDYDLMKRLAQAGSVHAKYRRMITVTVDITAPLYWWKEFDTYKVGTVANSCSTMHKIHSKEFELDDFSCERLHTPMGKSAFATVVDALNNARECFLNKNDKCYWDEMIQLLPTSYNQKRTVQMNYEVLVGMFRDRKNHKLTEWHTLCDWIRGLPYSELITGSLQ